MAENRPLRRAGRARTSTTGQRRTTATGRLGQPEERLRTEDLPQPDANLRKKTGKGYAAWFRMLDAWGAKERKHGEIARHLMDEHGVDGWWAQTITVGYERARGLRAKHQTLGGSFQVSVSKTFPIGVGKLYAAFADASQRNRWLERAILTVRTKQKNKTVRFDFRDGSSRVVAWFVPKDRSKTTVTIQHEKLAASDQVEEMRAMWKERLGDLADLLEA